MSTGLIISEDITIRQGDSMVREYTFSDQAGALINDSGAVYSLTVKYSTDDADAAAIFTATAHQTTAGTVFLTIAPTDTASLTPPAVLVYDVRVRETTGRVTSLAGGTFTVLPAVLRTP